MQASTRTTALKTRSTGKSVTRQINTRTTVAKKTEKAAPKPQEIRPQAAASLEPEEEQKEMTPYEKAMARCNATKAICEATLLTASKAQAKAESISGKCAGILGRCQEADEINERFEAKWEAFKNSAPGAEAVAVAQAVADKRKK